MAYRAEDVERAAEGLPVPLRDILHTLLRRNPAERFATAAELETVMRARLAQLGPYTGEDAVKEVQRALVAAGERLWALEVPEDEGGITPPVTEAVSEEERSTTTEPSSGSRTATPSTRHQDEVTTAPGNNGQRQPRKKQPNT